MQPPRGVTPEGTYGRKGRGRLEDCVTLMDVCLEKEGEAQLGGGQEGQ